MSQYFAAVARIDGQCTALRANVQGFVRRFGLLSEDSTPCGQPLPLSHAHALMFLLDQGGAKAVCQRDLAAALGLDKSSVARLCGRMESAGHVDQKRSEADGRAREVELTIQGIRVARQIEKGSRERFARILAAIPMKQRGQVVEAIEILNAALQTLEMPS
jgi:DNA-binding MarR family transcriptional regulator